MKYFPCTTFYIAQITILFLCDLSFPALHLYPLFLFPLIFSIFSLPIYVAFLSVIIYPVLSLLATSLDPVSIDFLINYLVRLVLYGFILLFAYNYRMIVSSSRRRIAYLQSIVPQCEQCGFILCSDGVWRSIDILLTNPSLFGSKQAHNCHSNI